VGRQALIMKYFLPASALLAFALVGCGSDTPQATAEQAKSFEGGPMPQEYKDKIAKMQQAGPPAGVPAGK